MHPSLRFITQLSHRSWSSWHMIITWYWHEISNTLATRSKGWSHGLGLTMWTAPWGSWGSLALAVGSLGLPVEDSTVLSVFQHAPQLRCRTRMFSAPTNPPEDMAIMERVQQSAHWCARHPGDELSMWREKWGGTWVSLGERVSAYEMMVSWLGGVFLKRTTDQSMVRLKIAWWVLVVWFLLTFHPLVGGLEHFSIYWECHHPNWRTHIFQRGRSTTNQLYHHRIYMAMLIHAAHHA